ncbi:MAG: hypothetical protein AB7G15_17385 [Alphaproteobacteria bacterium]
MAAYRAAYKTDKQSAALVARRAERLRNHPSVAAQLSRRAAPTARRSPVAMPEAERDKGAAMTAQQHIDELLRLRDLAVANKQISAAITAEINRAKIAGLHDAQAGLGATEIEKLSDDALVARIKHLIAQTGIAVLPDDLAGAPAPAAHGGLPPVSETDDVP